MAGTVDYNSGATFTDMVNNVFKEWYKDGAPPDLTMKDHPSYGLLPKGLWTGGDPYIYGVKVANMAGRSKDFSAASSNDSPAQLAKFQLTTVKDYARTSFDNETMMRLKTDAQGFFDYVTEQVDGGFTEIADVMAHELFRDGTGVVATVGDVTAAAASVITLADPADIKAFGLNQVIEFWDVSAGAKSVAAVVANGRISNVDHAAGSFTIASDVSATYTTTPVAGDKIAFGGDLASDLANTQALAGFEGWNPEAAPTTGDDWFALDRSIAPSYLAGGREDFSSGYGMREALMTWCSRANRYRGKWDIVIINPENFTELEKELTSISYLNLSVSSPNDPIQIGYRAIELPCAWGTVAVVSDADCPLNVARGVTFSALKLLTVGNVGPYVIDADGLTMLRAATTDSFEMRIGYYGNIACHNPKMLSRCKLPSVSA